MVAVALWTIFLPAGPANSTQQHSEVLKAVSSCRPLPAEAMAAAEEDILAHIHYPEEHRTRIYSKAPCCRSRGKSSNAPA